MNNKTNNIKNRIANNKLLIAKKRSERRGAIEEARKLRDEIKALRKANKHLKQEIKTAEKLDIVNQAIRDLNSK